MKAKDLISKIVNEENEPDYFTIPDSVSKDVKFGLNKLGQLLKDAKSSNKAGLVVTLGNMQMVITSIKSKLSTK